MTAVITWATPDQYPNIDIDISFFIIQKQTGGVGPFVTIATINATTDGLPKSSTNLWINQFEDVTGTLNDVYQVAAKNASGEIGQFSAPGKGGYLSAFHDVMDTVRFDLGDDNPLFYQLDSVPQFKWVGTQLGRFVTGSLRDFNGASPMVTVFTFSTLPQDVIPVLEDAVMYRALRSRAIKEIPNYLKYSDGVDFDMTNRPRDYMEMEDKMWKRFLERSERWKLTHRPEAIGLGSQRLPFRVTRPLSMLPNMKNVFGF